MNTKERVRKYLQWGFNVLPAKDGAKYPVGGWQKYQKERYSPEEIEEYLNHGKENWVVVCGKISGNLLVLDFDDPQIYEEYVRKIEPELLETFTVKTGKKGYHVYYRTPEAINSTKMGKIDILGEGKLAVLPPSIHPETGQRYEVIRDLEPLKIEKEEWDYIFSVLREITGQKTPETGKLKDNAAKIIETILPYWREGQRDTLEYAFLGYIRKKGISEDVARAILEKIIELTGDEERSMRMAVLERNYKLSPEELKGYAQLKEILKEKDVQKLEKYVKGLAGAVEDTTKEEEEEKKKEIRKVPYIDLEDDLYLAVCNEHDNYKFAHLARNGDIEFLDKVEVNGRIYIPKEKGKIPIGYPSFDIVHAPDLTTGEIVELLKEHIWKYVDMSEDDLDMAIFFILHTWFYRKSNTTAYLRFLGDTGKGKSRMLKVIGNLCFYPLILGGNATRSAIMRVHKMYGGTLVLDEADFKGDKEDELTTYINSGFEKDTKAVITDNNTGKPITYPSFSPKLFAMRHPFRDSATEGRLLSIEPYETRRKDIPAVLPLSYDDEVIELRNILAKWALKNWSKVKMENREFIQELPIEPRLKQLATPLSIILPLFSETEEMKNKFVEWLLRRQKQIIEDRKNSPEGWVFNAIISLASGDTEDLPEKYKDYLYNPQIDGEDYSYTQEDEGKPIVISTGMLKEYTKMSAYTLKKILKELGFKVEKRKIKIKDMRKTPHVVLLEDPMRWEEDWRRYVDIREVGEIPEILEDERIDYNLVPKVPDSKGDAPFSQKNRLTTLKGYINNFEVTHLTTGTSGTKGTSSPSLADKTQKGNRRRAREIDFIKVIIEAEEDNLKIALPERDIGPLKKGDSEGVHPQVGKILQKNGKAKIIGKVVDIYGVSEEISTPEERIKFWEEVKKIEIPTISGN